MLTILLLMKLQKLKDIELLLSNKRRIMTTKDKIIRQLKHLDIVALNLKIEAARLKESNAISVVADNIEKAIVEIEKEIEEM